MKTLFYLIFYPITLIIFLIVYQQLSYSNGYRDANINYYTDGYQDRVDYEHGYKPKNCFFKDDITGISYPDYCEGVNKI